MHYLIMTENEMIVALDPNGLRPFQLERLGMLMLLHRKHVPLI